MAGMNPPQIRRTAGQPMPSTRGELVATLVALRQLLQRLLTAVGSLVALSTLATGAGVALQRSQLPGSSQGAAAELPPQFVLVFGGAGSLLVALFYVPAATALQRRGQELRDALFPLDKADEPSTILSLAEDRHKLEQLLGMDRGVVANLQTGLTILGPLLASAAATFCLPSVQRIDASTATTNSRLRHRLLKCQWLTAAESVAPVVAAITTPWWVSSPDRPRPAARPRGCRGRSARGAAR